MSRYNIKIMPIFHFYFCRIISIKSPYIARLFRRFCQKKGVTAELLRVAYTGNSQIRKNNTVLYRVFPLKTHLYTFFITYAFL